MYSGRETDLKLVCDRVAFQGHAAKALTKTEVINLNEHMQYRTINKVCAKGIML